MRKAPSGQLPLPEVSGAAGPGSQWGGLVPWLAATAGLLLAVLVIGGGSWWGVAAWNAQALGAERNAVAAILTRWERSAPDDIDPHIWREVVVVVHNAMGNVCFSYHHVRVAEMRRLRREVEAKDRAPITLDTLEWLWNRLGKTGPHGMEYIERMRPLWEEARAAAEQSRVTNG